MNARAWFVLGLRLFGVWMLYRAGSWTLSLADMKIHELSGAYAGETQAPTMSYVLNLLAYGLAGGYFLFFTNHLARMLYPPGCCESCGHPRTSQEGAACPECGMRGPAPKPE